MKKKLVIWGASGHAKVVTDIISLNDRYEIVGYLNDVTSDLAVREFCGVPVLGGQEQLGLLHNQGIEHVIIGFGNCSARLKVAKLVIKNRLELATAIHPAAIVAKGVLVGSGTVLVAGSVINSAATIGENVIINTCASVDHDCVIHDCVHIAPGAHLSGNVHVGRGTWIGLGALIKEGVHVGCNCIVGAGSLVLNDIPDNVVAYGSPTRIIRGNHDD